MPPPFAVERRRHHHAPVLSLCRALQCTDAQHSHIVLTAGSTRATCRLSRRVSIPARHSLLVTPGARGIHHTMLQRIYIVSYRQTHRLLPTHSSVHTRSYVICLEGYRSREDCPSIYLYLQATVSLHRPCSSRRLVRNQAPTPQSNLAPFRVLHRSKHTTTRPSTSVMRDSNGVSYPCPPLAHCNLYGQVHDLVQY